MIGISINKKSYDMNKVWMSVSFFHTHTHIFDQWKQIQENTFCFKNRNENSDEKLIVNDDFHHQDDYLMIRDIQQKKNISQ